MDIFSLDILKLAQIFPNAWRRIRGKSSCRNDEILRRNVEGLEIVVVNNKGKVIDSSIQVNTHRDDTHTSGIVETLSLSIEVDRIIGPE